MGGGHVGEGGGRGKRQPTCRANAAAVFAGGRRNSSPLIYTYFVGGANVRSHGEGVPASCECKGRRGAESAFCTLGARRRPPACRNPPAAAPARAARAGACCWLHGGATAGASSTEQQGGMVGGWGHAWGALSHIPAHPPCAHALTPHSRASCKHAAAWVCGTPRHHLVLAGEKKRKIANDQSKTA